MCIRDRWGVLGARDVGAPHKRERIWVLGYASSVHMEASSLVEAYKTDGEFGGVASDDARTILAPSWPGDQPCMVGLDDGVARWVDRAKAIGNGQVPAVAALAWNTLTAG